MGRQVMQLCTSSHVPLGREPWGWVGVLQGDQNHQDGAIIVVKQNG